MKPSDLVKAAAVALVVMVVNVAISVAVVAVYSLVGEPGHDEAYYQDAAGRIAPWSSVVFGAPLFFLAAFLMGRRTPTRDAFAFASACVAVYAIVDVAALVAAGDVLAHAGIVALSLGTKLAGALLGARSAQPR